MLAYMLRRALEVIPTLFLISLVVFSLMRVSGGDPIAIMLGPQGTPELIQKVREQFDLDKPVHTQYLMWIGRAARGDLGHSIRTRERVVKMIGDRALSTLTLALLASLFSVIAGVAAGVVSAVRRNTAWDYAAMFMSILGISFPNYFIALVLILLFGIMLPILPMFAVSVDIMREPIGTLKALIMPTIALGAGFAALIARMVRSSLLEVLSSDYIRTARAKGLPEWRVNLQHALKNALIPVIALVAVNFVYMLGGSIIIEEIFSLPGVGALLVRAVLERDFPVIQGVTLVSGLLFILASLVADLLYAWIDPRIHYQ